MPPRPVLPLPLTRHGHRSVLGRILELRANFSAYDATYVALASLPNFTLPGDLSPSARYWERDIVSPEWTMDHEGLVRVPLDGAGMGVDVDRDRVEDLTVRREVLE